MLWLAFLVFGLGFFFCCCKVCGNISERFISLSKWDIISGDWELSTYSGVRTVKTSSANAMILIKELYANIEHAGMIYTRLFREEGATGIVSFVYAYKDSNNYCFSRMQSNTVGTSNNRNYMVVDGSISEIPLSGQAAGQSPATPDSSGMAANIATGIFSVCWAKSGVARDHYWGASYPAPQTDVPARFPSTVTPSGRIGFMVTNLTGGAIHLGRLTTAPDHIYTDGLEYTHRGTEEYPTTNTSCLSCWMCDFICDTELPETIELDLSGLNFRSNTVSTQFPTITNTHGEDHPYNGLNLYTFYSKLAPQVEYNPPLEELTEGTVSCCYASVVDPSDPITTPNHYNGFIFSVPADTATIQECPVCSDFDGAIVLQRIASKPAYTDIIVRHGLADNPEFPANNAEIIDLYEKSNCIYYYESEELSCPRHSPVMADGIYSGWVKRRPEPYNAFDDPVYVEHEVDITFLDNDATNANVCYQDHPNFKIIIFLYALNDSYATSGSGDVRKIWRLSIHTVPTEQYTCSCTTLDVGTVGWILEQMINLDSQSHSTPLPCNGTTTYAYSISEYPAGLETTRMCHPFFGVRPEIFPCWYSSGQIYITI